MSGECEGGRIGRKPMVQFPETLSRSMGSCVLKMVHRKGLHWAEMVGPSCAPAQSLAGTECVVDALGLHLGAGSQVHFLQQVLC